MITDQMKTYPDSQPHPIISCETAHCPANLDLVESATTIASECRRKIDLSCETIVFAAAVSAPVLLLPPPTTHAEPVRVGVSFYQPTLIALTLSLAQHANLSLQSVQLRCSRSLCALQ